MIINENFYFILVIGNAINCLSMLYWPKGDHTKKPTGPNKYTN